MIREWFDRACYLLGAWVIAAAVLFSLAIAIRELLERRKPRCSLCFERLAAPYPSRFGQVCVGCYDAISKLYRRTPRRRKNLTDEQARRIMENLWRDVDGYEFGGDGWRNG